MTSEKLEVLSDASVNAAVVFEVLDYMLRIIEHHIEKRLQSRKMLEQNFEQGL